MTAQTLQCWINSQSGSIERLLRTIRVRGFAIHAMTLQSNDTGYVIEMAVSGRRDLANLAWQLRKLMDVHRVMLPGNEERCRGNIRDQHN